VQNHVKPEQIPIGMSTLIFTQTFSGALFLTFADLIFSNGLETAMPHFAPEVDVQAVIQAGATGFRTIVPAASLHAVLVAYNQAVNHVFYLLTGAGVALLIFSWGMGWKSVKKAKVVAPEV
jgi:hypothetical protein